jgi:hypothetical protein
MLQDIRHAVRVLLQTKGWTAVVLLSLSIGIGANTALFSAVNGLLLQEIPVKDPGELREEVGRSRCAPRHRLSGARPGTPRGAVPSWSGAPADRTRWHRP